MRAIIALLFILASLGALGQVSTNTGVTGTPSNLTRSGNHPLTITTTGSTDVTLPTSGTLAILGANIFTASQTIGQGGASPAAGLTLNGGNGGGQGANVVLKVADATVGGMYSSGNILGTAATDLAFFAETGKVINFMADGSVTNRFQVSGTGTTTVGTHTATTLVATASSSPASNAACTAGTLYWDADYIYVCTASGVVKRAALTGAY